MGGGPVLIVDALNLFTTHFVANPALSKGGEHTGESAGGIVGFLSSLRWIMETVHPRKVIVVWESGGSSRKRKLFSEYKAHRRPQKLNRFYSADELPDTVDNKNWQISTLVDVMRLLGVCQVYVKDCEADDVIGYISRYKLNENSQYIVSADKDYYQLLGENVSVYNPLGKRFVRPSDVTARFRITPRNFCIGKALCGDPSDNVPGIKGCGFKTLAKLFPKLTTDETVALRDVIDEAKARAAAGEKSKVVNRIAEGEDVIVRNWKLMLLDTGNLSASQVSQVNHQFDTFTPKLDKMGLMRCLVKGGLSAVDADRLFMLCATHLKSREG